MDVVVFGSIFFEMCMVILIGLIGFCIFVGLMFIDCSMFVVLIVFISLGFLVMIGVVVEVIGWVCKFFIWFFSLEIWVLVCWSRIMVIIVKMSVIVLYIEFFWVLCLLWLVGMGGVFFFYCIRFLIGKMV